MLLKRGDSPELNRLRDEIETKHPCIRMVDIPHFYDTSIFNECEQTGCIMETLDIWKEVHPSIVTIPVEWDFKTYYGIVYAKSPSKAVRDFIQAVRQHIKIGYGDASINPPCNERTLKAGLSI